MSPETIVRTELFSPPPHLNLAVYPRLQSKLADTLFQETCLVPICTPAGFGGIAMAAMFHEVNKAIGVPLFERRLIFTASNDQDRKNKCVPQLKSN